MENNKPSVYESVKNTLSYISNKFFKSISCSVMSTRRKSETLPLPMEDLEGIKEPEKEGEAVVVIEQQVAAQEQPSTLPVELLEPVIVENPVSIEDRM
jgi:hypothetical protein